MKKTLYLHVGHSKTGSSYLQSLFAINADVLDAQGIHHPAVADTARAAEGKITSGNGRQLLQRMQAFVQRDHAPDDALLSDDRSMLFSSEALIGFLTCARGVSSIAGPMRAFWDAYDAGDRLDLLTRWGQAHGFERVSVLLFIRNPIAHFCSSYQQHVKRLGSTLTIDEASRGYSLPTTVLKCVELLSGREHVALDVRNYSVVREALAESACDWLGISHQSLSLPPHKIINRSLTFGELELQRVLNGHLGRSGAFLSDPLCDELPDISADGVYPSLDTQETLWRRLLPTMQAVNERIPDPHHYRFDRKAPPAGEQEYRFSARQIEVIGRSLGESLARLKAAESVDSERQTETRQLQARVAELEDRLQALQSAHAQSTEKLARFERDSRGLGWLLAIRRGLARLTGRVRASLSRG